jgi:DNA-binding XRE family transcriptional regulator
MDTFWLWSKGQMTRREYERATRMLDELIAGMHAFQLGAPDRNDLGPLLNTAVRLKKMFVPPPTMEEILLKVPGETHTERALEIGISRQGYYNLLGGQARPNAMTAKRLAELTGYKIETIREAW